MEISTELLISSRETTHGNFVNTARYIQQFKHVMRSAQSDRHRENRPPLTPQQAESLEMILHKAGRIISGDPNVADHWDDIAAYAKLALKEI